MNWESKKSFERKEKLFMAGILPIGNMTSRRKQRKFPERFYTVEQMLSTAGIKIEDQIPEIQQKAKDVVSGVCRVGSRFTKRCICVQLYEDASDSFPMFEASLFSKESTGVITITIKKSGIKSLPDALNSCFIIFPSMRTPP